jgi:hypothetical protein
LNTMIVTPADARQITDRIRGLLENAHAAATTLRAAIADAHERQVYIALGYESWTAYVSEEFRGLGSSLDRGNRQVLVMELADLGMSTRAIAPVVGVDRKTVERDVRAAIEVGHDVPPATPEPAVADYEREAIKPPPAPAPRVVTGLDGKSYTRMSRDAIALRVERARELAAAGATSEQIAADLGISFVSFRGFARRASVDVPADRVVGKAPKHDANRIVEHIVMDAENLTSDTRLINFAQLDHGELPAWIDSLKASRKALGKLIARLEGELS